MRRMMGTLLLAMVLVLGSLTGCGQQQPAASGGPDLTTLAAEVVQPLHEQRLQEALERAGLDEAALKEELSRPLSALNRWREILSEARGNEPSVVETTDSTESALPRLIDKIVERTSEQVQDIKQN